MRICVIGSGIAGLTAASQLSQQHEVTLFEANDYVGGHTHTVDVDDGQQTLAVDTGFIVFNEPNYPHLCQLFKDLGVPTRDSDMSFSVHCEQSALEWNGSSLNQVFAQRRNVLRPSHWRMLADIQRFHHQAPQALASLSDDISVSQWSHEHRYSRGFIERYLLPLGASLWSCSAQHFGNFPMRFVIEFLHNHRMLQVSERPQWKTVVGGSREYVRRLIKPFERSIHLNTVVSSVRRIHAGVEVKLADGHIAYFDEVVLACHADQSLRLLSEADEAEREVLGAFPYQANEAVLHHDIALLPDRHRAWASWNYRIPKQAPSKGPGEVCVTYNMNMLQGLRSDKVWCVSLNPGSTIDPEKVVQRLHYDHPLFSPGRGAAQARHKELIRRRGLSFCGAYWGYGFHEDGIRSALDVCKTFANDLEAAA